MLYERDGSDQVVTNLYFMIGMDLVVISLCFITGVGQVDRAGLGRVG